MKRAIKRHRTRWKISRRPQEKLVWTLLYRCLEHRRNSQLIQGIAETFGLLKPKKPQEDATSYHFMALLSMERLLCNRTYRNEFPSFWNTVFELLSSATLTIFLPIILHSLYTLDNSVNHFSTFLWFNLFVPPCDHLIVFSFQCFFN